MKTWDQFLKGVRPYAPGISDPLAEEAVRKAAKEFCRRTRAWRVVMDAITTVTGTDEYTLELPSRTELVRLESAKFNSVDINIGSMRSGRPCRQHIACDDGRTIIFGETPAAGLALVIVATIAPSDRAQGVDSAIGERYATEIENGALAILLSDANRRAVFDADMARVRVALWRGNSSLSPRAVPNFF